MIDTPEQRGNLSLQNILTESYCDTKMVKLHWEKYSEKLIV